MDTLNEQFDRNKNRLKPVPVLMTAKNNLEDTLINFLSMLQEMFDPENKGNPEEDKGGIEKWGLQRGLYCFIFNRVISLACFQAYGLA